MSTWEARNYPAVGSRLELIELCQPDPWTKLEPGTQGTVKYVDDAGTIHVQWENGSSLGLIYPDKFKLIEEVKP